MIFDELGLPKDNGATDFNDSARLAGIMTVFDWPQTVNLTRYMVDTGPFSFSCKWVYCRHPNEIKYDMSRDQAVCLIAGLRKQNKSVFVNRMFITGKDILSPSVTGHIRRCQGRKATWLQDQWLKFDILWAAYVAPEAELNQLLVMCVIAGPTWVKLLTKHHKTWKENLRDYWALSFRNEPELCEWMIQKVEAV